MTQTTPRQGRLSPSTDGVSPIAKVKYSVELLRDSLGEHREDTDFSWLWEDIAEYDELLKRYSSRSLSEASVVEIGFGARPERLLAMMSSGVDARGVDAESPVLLGRPSEFREMLRRNGAERALKSAVRFVLFDRKRKREFRAELRRHNVELKVDLDRFAVGDAATYAVEPNSVDLITSEDVFEHISRSSLDVIVPKLARWLKPDGLALIRPNVFTGITGGHLLEWNRRSFRLAPHTRRSEPWDHLRRREFDANTSLNELTRADYRTLFESAFEILEERVKIPDLGREFLTPTLREELAGYDEDELLSNQVLFVLRKRAR